VSSDRCTRIRAPRATPRRAFDRALAPPRLHRQHFTRSSYRCEIRLTGSCNSIVKDEHPSLHRLLRPCGQSELRVFTTLGSLRLPGPGSRIGIFFRFEPRLRRASDAPHPLPRCRVNDTGFKCELGTPPSRNTAASPPLADTTRWLARRPRRQPQPTTCPNEHDNTHQLLQSTQSPSTLAIDRHPALCRFSRAERCASRRSGDAKPHRPFSPEPAPCWARKPALVAELGHPVTGAGPNTLEGGGVVPKPA
jgi:hypothetical protein